VAIRVLTATLAVAALYLLAALNGDARGATAATAHPVVAEAFALPLKGAKRSGHLALHETRTGNGGPALELRGSGHIVRPLVHSPGALSLDVMVPAGATLDLGFGNSHLLLRGRARGAVAASSGSWHANLRPRRGWAGGGWHHIELATGASPRLAVDGRSLRAPVKLAGPLVVRPRAGAPRIAGLVATAVGDRGALILHRLAELHARVARGEYPFGTGHGSGTLHLSDGWTSGFWPGALWRARDLSGGSALFRSWALSATLAHLGKEREQTHDQGFLYLESSAAAYDRICRTASSRGTRTCRRLRASALRAAGTLLSLQHANAASGTIPTLPASKACRMCGSKAEAETIIDSMMNVSLLDWAYAHTHTARYRSVALAHSRRVAQLLVRDDGSTFQAVRVRRSDGKLLGHETHQGISTSSTWARGQAWAVYGFAYTGAATDDKALVGVSEKAARYVAGHLPAGGVPPYDYAAKGGKPVDTSAGVITAAGLFRLADACAAVSGSCTEADRWRPLAERMLAASLGHVRTRPPLGFLDDQVFTVGGHARWDDRGEFIFGSAYGLEGVLAADGG
jgi:unsaturated chondroitin disaccharide hydrolase